MLNNAKHAYMVAILEPPSQADSQLREAKGNHERTKRSKVVRGDFLSEKNVISQDSNQEQCRKWC